MQIGPKGVVKLSGLLRFILSPLHRSAILEVENDIILRISGVWKDVRLARIATALLHSQGTESIYHTYIKSRNAKRACGNLALRAQELKLPERQIKSGFPYL